MIQKLPRWVSLLIALVIFGMIRTPLESTLRTQLVDSHLLSEPPARDTFMKLGQSTLMGTLGGLRPLVAVYLGLKAHNHFSYTEWDELDTTYGLITGLEPREEDHWVHWIWHIGINATANVQTSRNLTPRQRETEFNRYIQRAIQIGDDALKEHPRSADIRLQIAELYREKLKDPCEASRLYGEMIGLPDSLSYVERFHYYFMADCPGREKDAYEGLIRLYKKSENNHLPTLIVKIKKLEVLLKIPIHQWIPDQDPDELIRRQRRSGEPLPGGIRLP